jgi:hypothetical protein
MKDCFYQYRKGLYEALNGNITYDGSAVPVMEYAGFEQATPYIQILNMNAAPETDHDTFSQIVTTDLQVVTSHQGEIDDFGSKQSDTIMDDVMDLLISLGVTDDDRDKHIEMDDFEDMGCTLVNLSYETSYDGTKLIISKVLTIRTMIDEV